VKYNKDKIVVTGSTGYIGSNLINKMTSDNIIFETLSYQDKSFDDVLIPHGSIFIHLAAIAHSDCKDEKLILHTNRDLPIYLAKKAKKLGYKKFIFLSSSLVWGSKYDHIDKNTVELPDTIYGRSKLEAENELLKLKDESFTISIIRVPVVYGAGVKGNIIKLIKAVHKWPLCPLSVEGNQRSFANLENLTDLIIYLSKKDYPGIFCFHDNKPISSGYLINAIARELPTHGYIFELPNALKLFIKIFNPKVHKKLFGSYLIDTIDLKHIGFIPEISFNEGISKMVAQYLKDVN
jgi:nucleoside-diphosphate-sugar epimerase